MKSNFVIKCRSAPKSYGREKFRPHRFTMNSFGDGSGFWILEWRDSHTYCERGWCPKDGYTMHKSKGSVWVDCEGITYEHTGGTSIPRELARNIIKAWKINKKWEK